MEFSIAPKKSNMLCCNCIYGESLPLYTVRCRQSPHYAMKGTKDWCGSGLWPVWSDRFNSWTYFYYHEGSDDNSL